ncbi:MAG: hypothetical protein AB7U63_17790 [Porticoccaceae bacterium]
MIEKNVFSFHESPKDDWTWTETTFLFFSVPEEGISGSIYVLARPNLGVCHSSIEIHKGFCLHPWQTAFMDAQMHLPCPENFSNFKLPNGLEFEVTNDPKDFRFAYKSKDGACAFDLDFKALSYPFDPHDPNDNPLLKTDVKAAKVPGYEGWHNGHMESNGRITGTLELNGKKYRVDCIDGMDKSWGPRPDFGQEGASWLHVSTGNDFSAFLAVALNFDQKEIVYGPLRFGFVSDNGETTGIVEAEMKSQRRDMHSLRTTIKFRDAKNRVFEAVGTPLAAAPWYTFNPSAVSYQTLMQWQCNGKTGASHLTDFVGINYLARGMADQYSC